jgi:hypothetical protein
MEPMEIIPAPNPRVKLNWHLACVTVNGRLSNIILNEYTTIKMLNYVKPRESDPILAIRSNGGIIYHPNNNLARVAHTDIERKREKNERAKAKKTARAHKRQGQGIEFNSSISFYVVNPDTFDTSKYYILKLFRNGSYNCLGVLREDFYDLDQVVRALTSYLEYALQTFEKLFPYPTFIDKVNLRRQASEKICVTRYVGPIIDEHHVGDLYKWIYHIHLDSGRNQCLDLNLLNLFIGSPADREIQERCAVIVVSSTYKPSDSSMWITFRSAIFDKKIHEPSTIKAKITRLGKVNLNGRAIVAENENIKRYLAALMDRDDYVVHEAIGDISSSDDED